MLEFYLRSPRGLARARSSSAGPYLDDFAVALRELGYCWRIGAWCITYAVHLGLWATALVERIGDDPAAYEPRALRAAVRELTGSHGVDTARFVAKVARAFLRYLAVEGLVDLVLMRPFYRWQAGVLLRCRGTCRPSPCSGSSMRAIWIGRAVRATGRSCCSLPGSGYGVATSSRCAFATSTGPMLAYGSSARADVRHAFHFPRRWAMRSLHTCASGILSWHAIGSS
jgi:hypothetical protein